MLKVASPGAHAMYITDPRCWALVLHAWRMAYSEGHNDLVKCARTFFVQALKLWCNLKSTFVRREL